MQFQNDLLGRQKLSRIEYRRKIETFKVICLSSPVNQLFYLKYLATMSRDLMCSLLRLMCTLSNFSNLLGCVSKHTSSSYCTPSETNIRRNFPLIVRISGHPERIVRYLFFFILLISFFVFFLQI